jgi:hypothetical protein
MNKLFYFFTAILSIFILSSCASIVTGRDQNLTFNSEPDGATVTVSGKVVGKTPISVQIDKGKNQALVFEKEGYKTFTTQLSTRTNSWFWGNIVLGGFFGSSTDGISGAIYEFFARPIFCHSYARYSFCNFNIQSTKNKGTCHCLFFRNQTRAYLWRW